MRHATAHLGYSEYGVDRVRGRALVPVSVGRLVQMEVLRAVGVVGGNILLACFGFNPRPENHALPHITGKYMYCTLPRTRRETQYCLAIFDC